MPQSPRLFAVTHWLLRVGTVLCIVGASLLTFCAVGCLVLMCLGDRGLPALVEGAPRNQVLLFATMAMVGGVICLLLAAMIFHLFARIVESARAGDPFVAVNADRLARSGFLLLGIYGVGILTAITVAALMPRGLHNLAGKCGEGIHVSGPDIGPVGIISVLLIFVLAQIFRHGAQMRAELEGTV